MSINRKKRKMERSSCMLSLTMFRAFTEEKNYAKELQISLDGLSRRYLLIVLKSLN